MVLVSRGLPNLAVVESDGRINQLGHLGVSPVYMESGYVLYNSLEGNLMALPVDRRTVEPRGTPFLVMDGVRVGANAVGLWAASTNGTIVAQRSNSAGSNIVAVDRAGRATPLSDEAKLFRMPRVSPDGRVVAFTQVRTGRERRLYVAPFSEALVPEDQWSAVVEGPSLDRQPVWAPTGSTLYFLSERDGARCVWAQRVDTGTRRAVGTPFAALHMHQFRYSLGEIDVASIGLSIANGQLFFASSDLQSNVWLAERRLIKR